MKLLKQHVRILIVIVIASAVVVAGSIYAKNRVSQPVWNDVRLDDSISIHMGMEWDETIEGLQVAGLDFDENSLDAIPLKDGKTIGISFTRSSDGKSVHSIYYDIGQNETDCVIYLAGARVDQASYEDMTKLFGKESGRDEVKNGMSYYWIDKDKELIVDTDEDGKLLNFHLWPYGD